MLVSVLLIDLWAHSLTDRMTGFGPVDRGSIPRELVRLTFFTEKSFPANQKRIMVELRSSGY